MVTDIKNGMRDNFLHIKVFRLQAMAIPLEATEGVNATLNPRIRHTPAHAIFLSISWLKT